MKALKEKRVSLRSFLRRGLVILSLFALVFVSCGDSDDGSTPPTGPTTIVPTGPKVTSITILSQPVNESYQGFAPDLTGLIAEVAFDDGTSEIVTDISRFTTSPGYCDVAWPGTKSDTDPTQFGDGSDPYTGLSLVYLGQNAPSNQLKIPMVVGATKIDITGTPQPWYADERPNFAGLAYEVTYERGWLGLGVNSVKDVPNAGKKLKAPMTSVYPKVDYKDAAADKKITVFIGPTIAGGGGVDSAGADSTEATRAKKTNTATGSFWVPNYYGVAGVTVVPGTPWDVYFDDDVSRFYNLGLTSIDQSKVYAELKKSNVKFEVTYVGTSRSKQIDIETFIGNSFWYKGLQSGQGITSVSMLGDLIVTDDGLRVSYPGATSILNYGRDPDNDEAWAIRLDYAPWSFGTSAAYTHVDVPFPLYLFDDLVVSKTAAGAVTIPGSYSARTMDDWELVALQGKWKLEGVYVSGRTPARKEIPLTKPIFYAGFYGASLGTTSFANSNSFTNGPAAYYVFFPNSSALGFNSLGPGAGLATGGVRRDFPLPVYYRGVLISDDEGVTADLLQKD